MLKRLFIVAVVCKNMRVQKGLNVYKNSKRINWKWIQTLSKGSNLCILVMSSGLKHVIEPGFDLYITSSLSLVLMSIAIVYSLFAFLLPRSCWYKYNAELKKKKMKKYEVRVELLNGLNGSISRDIL